MQSTQTLGQSYLWDRARRHRDTVISRTEHANTLAELPLGQSMQTQRQSYLWDRARRHSDIVTSWADHAKSGTESRKHTDRVTSGTEHADTVTELSLGQSTQKH